MNYAIRAVTAGLFVVAFAGCSVESGDEQAEKDHVWKGQTESIDKAREVETLLEQKQQKQDSQ